MNEHNIDKSNGSQALDCEGFLNDVDFWTADIAEKLAKDNQVSEYGLTVDHWKVIIYIRDHYLQYGRGPEMVKVAKKCDLSREEICNLFPCGLVKGAYKVAGLPRPPGCI